MKKELLMCVILFSMNVYAMNENEQCDNIYTQLIEVKEEVVGDLKKSKENERLIVELMSDDNPNEINNNSASPCMMMKEDCYTCYPDAQGRSLIERLKDDSGQEDHICDCGSDTCALWIASCMEPFCLRSIIYSSGTNQPNELNKIMVSPDKSCFYFYKNINFKEHKCMGEGCGRLVSNGFSCTLTSIIALALSPFCM